MPTSLCRYQTRQPHQLALSTWRKTVAWGYTSDLLEMLARCLPQIISYFTAPCEKQLSWHCLEYMYANLPAYRNTSKRKRYTKNCVLSQCSTTSAHGRCCAEGSHSYCCNIAPDELWVVSGVKVKLPIHSNIHKRVSGKQGLERNWTWTRTWTWTFNSDLLATIYNCAMYTVLSA